MQSYSFIIFALFAAVCLADPSSTSTSDDTPNELPLPPTEEDFTTTFGEVDGSASTATPTTSTSTTTTTSASNTTLTNQVFAVGYVTVPNRTLATTIAEDLLADRLAATVNILPDVTTLTGGGKDIKTIDGVMMVFLTRMNLVPLAKLIIELDVKLIDAAYRPEVFFTVLTDASMEYLVYIQERTIDIESILAESLRLETQPTALPTEGTPTRRLQATPAEPLINIKFPHSVAQRQLQVADPNAEVTTVSLNKLMTSLTITTRVNVRIYLKVNGHPLLGCFWRVEEALTSANLAHGTFRRVFAFDGLVDQTLTTMLGMSAVYVLDVTPSVVGDNQRMALRYEGPDGIGSKSLILTFNVL